MKRYLGLGLAAALAIGVTTAEAATVVAGSVAGGFSLNVAPLDPVRATRFSLDIDASKLSSSFLTHRAFLTFKVVDAFDEHGNPVSLLEEGLGTQFLVQEHLASGQTHFEFLFDPHRTTCDPEKPPYRLCHYYSNHRVTLEGVTDGGEQVAFRYSLAAVPEPATWAMMIVGFGLAGATLRRQAAVRIAA